MPNHPSDCLNAHRLERALSVERGGAHLPLARAKGPLGPGTPSLKGPQRPCKGPRRPGVRFPRGSPCPPSPRAFLGP